METLSSFSESQRHDVQDVQDMDVLIVVFSNLFASTEVPLYKRYLHGGTTYLSKPVRSRFDFKKEVWHLTGKTLPDSNVFFKEPYKTDTIGTESYIIFF